MPPSRSQWNCTFTREYSSVKISSPAGPTTMAVCGPFITGLGVSRKRSVGGIRRHHAIGRGKAFGLVGIGARRILPVPDVVIHGEDHVFDVLLLARVVEQAEQIAPEAGIAAVESAQICCAWA